MYEYLTGKVKILCMGALSLFFIDCPAQNMDVDKLISQGQNHKQAGNSDSAIYYYNIGAELCLEVGRNDKAASCYDEIGKMYRMVSEYHKAYDFFNRALMARKLSPSADLALSHLLLSTAATRMNKDSIAIDHSLQAVLFALTQKDTLRLAQAYNNLGSQYYDLSTDRKMMKTLYSQQLIDSSLKYSKKSLYLKEYLSQHGLNSNIQNTWSNISLGFKSKSQYDSALYFSDLAYRERVRLMDTTGILTSFWNLGLIHFLDSTTSIDSAYFYWSRGKGLSEKYDGGAYQSQNLYLNLAEYFERQFDWDSAHYYLQKYIDQYSQVYNENNLKQMNELIAKYQTELKDTTIKAQEAEIKRSALQRDFVFVFSFLIIIFSIIFMVLARRRRLAIAQLSRKTKEIDNRKIDELLKDIEIASIGSMLIGQENERKRIAEDLHDRLGSALATVKLHLNSITDIPEKNRGKHKKVEDLLDSTVGEVRQIAHNMLSGVLTKFGLIAALKDLKENIESSNTIKMELLVYNLEERLEQKIELHLYRIVQEAVSNTLKHAQATEIILQLNLHDKDLTMTIEDDGVGFDPQTKEDKTGMGIKNIEARLTSINGKMNIDSGKGVGTLITIEIPIS